VRQSAHSASIGRTKHEDARSIREKSGKYVHRSFLYFRGRGNNTRRANPVGGFFLLVDSLTIQERSALMARVRRRDTSPERAVRTTLHAMGLRFRLHRRDLPGTPDIVLPKYATVILVHGCFWHRHSGCKKTTTPKSRRQFWAQKFRENIARDRSVCRQLASLGWSVVTVWECQTGDPSRLATVLSKKLKMTRPRQLTSVANTPSLADSGTGLRPRIVGCRGRSRGGDRR
jgi:DNA mismatch endonuclease (patch repair protein)